MTLSELRRGIVLTAVLSVLAAPDSQAITAAQATGDLAARLGRLDASLEILRRVVRIRFGGRDIPITTAEDLILLKLAFHRAKDLQDVRGMLWVQRGKLDLDYMREWSTRSLAPDVQHELEALISQYSSHK